MYGAQLFGQHEIAGLQRLTQNVFLVLPTETLTLADTFGRKKNGVSICYDKKYIDEPGDHTPKYDPNPAPCS